MDYMTCNEAHELWRITVRRIQQMCKSGDIEGAKKVFSAFDGDRIMFATDSPWETPADTMAFIDKLELSSEQKEKLFYKNAENLIKLSENK